MSLNIFTPIANTISEIETGLIVHLNVFNRFLNQQLFDVLNGDQIKTKLDRIYGFKIQTSFPEIPSLKINDNVVFGEIAIVIQIERNRLIKLECNIVISIKCIFDLYGQLKFGSQTLIEKILWLDSSELLIANRKFNLKPWIKKAIENELFKLVHETDLLLERKWHSLSLKSLYFSLSNLLYGLNKDYCFNLVSTDGKITIKPFQNLDNYCKTDLLLSANTKVIEANDKQLDVIPKLPLTQIADFDKQCSKIKLSGRISATHLKFILQESLTGKTITKNGKTIIIEQILDVQTDKFIDINFRISGDLNADIKLSGIPYVDLQSQEFKILELALDIDTGSKLKNAGLWFVNSFIEKQMYEAFNFIINDEKDKLQNLVDKHIETVFLDFGHDINLQVHDINVHKWRIVDKNIIFTLVSKFDLFMELDHP